MSSEIRKKLQKILLVLNLIRELYKNYRKLLIMNFSRTYRHKYIITLQNIISMTQELCAYVRSQCHSSRDHFVYQFISVKGTQRLKTTALTHECVRSARMYTPSLTYPVLILRSPHLSSLSLGVCLFLSFHPPFSSHSFSRIYICAFPPLSPESISFRPFSFAWVCPLSRHPLLCGIVSRIPIHPHLRTC